MALPKEVKYQFLQLQLKQCHCRHHTSPQCIICCHCTWRESQSVVPCEILTTCFSTEPTPLLPTPCAMWPIIQKYNIVHEKNRKYIMYSTVNRGRLRHGHRTFREVLTCGFWDIWADRQTDMLLATLRTQTGSKVITGHVIVSDIAIFVLKRDVKLQLTSRPCKLSSSCGNIS